MFCIEKEEMRRNSKGLWEMFMYVYCNEWDRHRWIESVKIRKGKIKDGRCFPKKGIYEMERFEDWFDQFAWKERDSKLSPYLRTTYKKKRLEAHKIILWELTGDPISHPLCVDHLDKNKFNNHPSNLEVVFLFENQERGKAFKGARQVPSGRWTSKFRGKHLGTFDTKIEALNARERAIQLYLAQHPKECNMKQEYNRIISDYVRKQRNVRKNNES